MKGEGWRGRGVEGWSDKEVVKGLSAFVTTFVFVFFCCCYFVVDVAGRTCTSLQRRIRGRAVKALRSGRSPLCGRGFESHRMQHFFFSSPPERPAFVLRSIALVFQTGQCAPVVEADNPEEGKTNTRMQEHKAKRMAVPGFEPGSSGSQPLMLTTTLYHQITNLTWVGLTSIRKASSWVYNQKKRQKIDTPEPGIEPGSPA